jgi:hypothetical protein
MAVTRCPRCNLPLTDAETSTNVCPCCAAPLLEAQVTRVADAAEPTATPPNNPRFYPILLVAALMVIAVLGGLYAGNWPRGQNRSDESAVPEALQADAPIHAAQEQARLAKAEHSAILQKLAAAEKSAADVVAQLQILEKQAAAEKERAEKLEREKKDLLAEIASLQAFKDSLPPKDGGKRVDAKIKIIADGVLRTIAIDKVDGEYRLPVLNKGAVVKLVGKVKTLRVEYVTGATLDASELSAGDIAFVSGINNGAQVKLKGLTSVTVPFIDTRSDVDIACPGGRVQIGWINGSAQVSLVARDFLLRDFLDGKDSTVTATLTKAGHFQFREIRGKSRFLWKKALDTDPEVEFKQGIIRAPAEFRQLPNG